MSCKLFAYGVFFSSQNYVFLYFHDCASNSICNRKWDTPGFVDPQNPGEKISCEFKSYRIEIALPNCFEIITKRTFFSHSARVISSSRNDYCHDSLISIIYYYNIETRLCPSAIFPGAAARRSDGIAGNRVMQSKIPASPRRRFMDDPTRCAGQNWTEKNYRVRKPHDNVYIHTRRLYIMYTASFI